MRKLISCALAAIMLLAIAIPMFAVNTSAADAYASKFTGPDCVDTTWYDKDNLKTEYHLTSAGQLAGLAVIVNENPNLEIKPFDGVKFYLDCDIILNEGNASDWAEGKNVENLNKWIPIGDQQPSNSTRNVNAPEPSEFDFFWGSFDGQGHIISGLYIDDPENMWTGLFSCFMGPYLGNLTITNSFIRGYGRVGAFAGIMHGTVAKKDVSKDTEADIASGNYALCENLYTDAYCYATANDTNARAGGVFGVTRILDKSGYDTRTNGGILIMRNLASSAIVNTGDTAGRWGGGITANIAGYASAADREGLYDIFFENCISTASIVSLGTNTGGICSEIYCVDLVFKNCLSALTAFTTASEKEFGAIAGGGANNGTNRFATVKFENSYYVPIDKLTTAVGALEGSTEDGVTSIANAALATGLDSDMFDLMALRLKKGVVYPEEMATKVVDSPKIEQTVETTAEPVVTTAAPVVTTKPVEETTVKVEDTTVKAADTTVKATENTTAAAKPEKSGCGKGSTILLAVQLIAVIGAAGVCLFFKKK